MKDQFHKVLDERNQTLHRLAVLQEIIEHLQKFLDTDVAPAKLGITTEGGGLTVPQPIIETMVREFEDGPITELRERLVMIDQREVAENVGKESESGAKAEPKGRKSKRGQGPKPGSN